MSDLKTPLYEAHVACGARIVPFAGYLMPVQYAGVLAEAKAVREGAGMFDVSHMARLWFRGARVLEMLEWITTNDVAALSDGRGQYSLLPNPSGGVVDDIIVYRVREGVFRMVINAANHAKDVTWIAGQNAFNVAMSDDTEATVMIAVQGPRATETLAANAAGGDRLREAPTFGIVEADVFGVPCFAMRSGYTGEDGYELICPVERGTELWNALVGAGVVPCGLGARDLLRVEAGLPLYGHELTDETNPISAGLGWVVGKEKSFIGADPINAARANGTPTKLQGVKLEGKRLPMPGMKVFVEDREVGTITSGVYSPILEAGIAFAYIASDVKLGTAAAVEIRGRREPATIVGKRFWKRAY